jgi:hypothetical protein
VLYTNPIQRHAVASIVFLQREVTAVLTPVPLLLCVNVVTDAA